MRMVWSSFIALATAGTLAGCGGGGGGGGGGGSGSGTAGRDGLITSTVRSGAADFTAEAARNYGLAQVGALGPFAANRAGAGVTVGIIDTGIDLEHQDFIGAIDPNSTDIISGINANVDDHGGHGTAVAGVIGARADGYDARGIAPESTLLAVRSEYACSPGCGFYHSDLARATTYAADHGAKVLNFSLGGNGVDPDWQTALTNALTPGMLADGITFDPAKERVIVAAAGNSGGANPIDPAAWLASASGQGRGLAVGAVGTDGVTLASFSNKAGTAKDYFLVAPGVSIVSSANGGGTRAVSGTSFSAPAVSGAAAVVWGASPFLTGKQVVDILLNSATDLGAAGVDDTYGHGLLNLDAALQPLGLASIPTGSTVSSGGAALASTSLSLGGAFGDALSKGGPLSQAMFLDAYGRPFNADLTGTVRTQAKSDPLAGWLGPNKSEITTTTLAQGTSVTLAAPPVLEPQFDVSGQPGEASRAPRFALSTNVGGNRLGLARGFGLDQMTGLAAAQPELAGTGMSGSLLSSPYLALSGDGTAMSAGRDLGDGVSLTLGLSQDGGTRSGQEEAEPDRKAALAEATKRFQDGSVLGAQLGSLTEASGPLNSNSHGAFDFDRQADTLFLGFFGATPLNDRVTLFGRWGLGMTDGAALRSALVQDSTDVTSQSFALGASVRDVGMDGDRLTFTTSKPLRVSSGSASLAVPVGRTMDGTVLYRDERVRLSPSGSETDFELSWAVPVGERQHLVLGGLVALEPGHDASAAPAFAGGAKYRLTW
ncbi:MAG: S8 family serine peptidase [Rhodospirillaceae bacterium]|nr:S8 family serine peptidase [Rhodospirillales bacterium]